MDFELTQIQQEIQKAARDFAKGEFDPDLTFQLDQNAEFPISIWKKASRLGLIGIHYPDEFEGEGLGFLEKILVVEELCKADSGIGSALNTVDLGSSIIQKFGSSDQKKQFLAPLANGEKMLSIGFAESEAKSDYSSFITTAKRVGQEYILNGKKRFVPNAFSADAFIVLCRESKEGWITLILEKKDGVKISPVSKMGLKMVRFGDLEFSGARVPFENRLGGEDEGLLHASNLYHETGLRSAAQALGISQGALEKATEFAKQRKTFGKKLSEYQVIRHKLADIAIGIEVARWLTYKAASDYDKGKFNLDYFAITQAEVGSRLTKMLYDSTQIFGGIGYMAEMDIEHYFRDAMTIAVDLGAEEELKDTIADKIIGVGR